MKASGFLKVFISLIYTGIMVVATLLAGLMVVCNGGGTLFFVLPVAIVTIHAYIKVMKALLRKKEPEADQFADVRRVKKISYDNRYHEAVVKYIFESRVNGLSDKAISENLSAANWSDEYIQKAFDTLK